MTINRGPVAFPADLLQMAPAWPLGGGAREEKPAVGGPADTEADRIDRAAPIMMLRDPVSLAW